MDSYLIFAYFIVCFARSSVGDSSYPLKGEECFLADLKKGECRSYEYCPTAVLSVQKQTQPQGCSTEGDICCELDPGPDYEMDSSGRSGESRDDASYLDEETDRFYRRRLRKNGYYGGKQTENYITQNNNYYNKPQDPRQGSYYNGKNNNRQQYWTYNDQGNSFVFPTQGPSSSNGYQNGNNYPWNSNHFGNQRQTTQRPRTSSYPYYWPQTQETTTLRPILPTYKPNLNTYRPQSQNEWNRKRISERKCEEYFEQTIPVASGLPLVLNPKPIKTNPQRCVAPQQLIVGGQNTTPGEYPHMALIYFRFRSRDKTEVLPGCGGSLISDQYVLTAAHCIESGGQPEKVLLGVYDYKTVSDDHPGFYFVARSIIHPGRRLPAKYNDIALLRLYDRVDLTYKIRPACLYTKFSLPEPKVVAVGWGKTEVAGELSSVLLQVSLNVYGKDFCSEKYKNHPSELPQQIIDSQICAGDIRGGKDTCKGDSGGPIELVRDKNSCNHFVVGVTSFGKICGAKDTAGVYTRVYSYLDWIESVVWPQ